MKSLRRIIPALLLLLLLTSKTPAAAGGTAETSGDVLSLLTPAAAYGVTFWHQDQQGRGQFEKSFLTAAGTTYGLKAVIDHDGPNGDSRSFPSGHTTLAFAGASFLQQRYGWRFGLPAMLAAGFVGYSRVQSDNHNWEDVAVGAGISFLSTWYFVSPYEKKVGLAPLVGDNLAGVALVGRW